jgi:alkanesulfonate monooxygenase SsuD/methylene tetrahydromethanopterin reductase-like flavin-dependent oxidoreductase (luciferase family)
MLPGSGVLQVGSRSPVLIAQTAITLSNLSNGRFLLGLGASGPQVVEGLHGVRFRRPPARIAETVDIVQHPIFGSGWTPARATWTPAASFTGGPQMT